MSLPDYTEVFTFEGIEIQLVVPDSSAVQARYRSGQLSLPYWSQVWPSSLGLTRFLSTNTHLLQGKTVLELAAGLGLPSLYAAGFSAHVVCSDYAEEATDFIRKSVNANKLTNVETRVIDWRALPSDLQAEVVLLSDVNYEPAAFPELHRVINDFLEKGSLVLIATPQRLAGKDFIELLLPYCGKQEVIELQTASGAAWINVFVLKAH